QISLASSTMRSGEIFKYLHLSYTLSTNNSNPLTSSSAILLDKTLVIRNPLVHSRRLIPALRISTLNSLSAAAVGVPTSLVQFAIILVTVPAPIPISLAILSLAHPLSHFVTTSCLVSSAIEILKGSHIVNPI